jgi:hypothetical protein
MRFNPLSEEEANAQASGVWEDGEYDYEVIEAEEKQSNAGNDMFALELSIFNANGSRKKVFDYLVISDKAAWKLRHFSTSCGLLAQYQRGSLMANEMIGRTGRCTIGTQAAKDSYPAKNVVRDYIGSAAPAQRSAQQRQRQPVPAGSDLDDEIPF